MKKKFLFMTALFAIILSGCNSDKEPVEVVNKEGDPTYMSVSITFPKAGQETRAPHDTNATDDEVRIKAVDIFIYNDQGYFLSSHSMIASQFTLKAGTEDRYESTEQIKTTTGPKIVYAGINLPASAVAAIKNQHMGRLADLVHIFSMADLTTISNGLAMFSVNGSAEDFTDDPSNPANKVSIDVKRLVAKITVEQATGMIQAGVPGDLADIMFAVNNFNTKMFLQQGASPEYKDPNWTNAQYNVLDFENTPAAGYVAVLDPAVFSTPNITDYKALYASENTSENKRKKEITRVTVRATFMPNEVTVVDTDPNNPDGYKQEARPGTITNPQTFYAVTPGVGEYTRYFYDKSVADQYVAATGSTLVTYDNGLCYWDMFLNKGSGTNQWDVLRNDYYKCTITKIVAPGKPSPDVEDPEVPPGTDTDITVEINIEFWNPVIHDYILEP